MTEKEKIEFLDKLVVAAQIFHIHGITTEKETKNIYKRLLKYISGEGYELEVFGFRQFEITKKD